MRKTLAFSVALTWLAVGVVPSRGSLADPVQRPSIQCQGGWTISKTPSLGATSILNDVTAPSESDVWAVGETQYRGLAMHFDGRSWSVVSIPSDTRALWGVAGTSSDDVWAVGQGGPEGVALLHWDGNAWSSVPTPSPGPNGGLLYDVAASAPNDVWAVGQVNGPAESGESSTLTEHWDGSAWTIVPSPSPFDNSHFLAVSPDSPSDVWALGLAEADRWDGAAWNLVSSAPPSWNKFFLDVAAFGADDVWATGYRLFPQTLPVFLHWDGRAWKTFTGPPGPEWGQMFGIGGPSGDRLWAVGGGSQGVLMERWNGASWRFVPAPSPPGNTTAVLFDVVVDSNGMGWAVGSTAGWGGDVLAEHTCRP
jgi:hypothetical protein